MELLCAPMVMLPLIGDEAPLIGPHASATPRCLAREGRVPYYSRCEFPVRSYLSRVEVVCASDGCARESWMGLQCEGLLLRDPRGCYP